jgi:uncharacterized BrkB/YihY/UPF0761 family membrane protein
VRWTVFKSQFFGFAAQKYSAKPQLKNCHLARRYNFKSESTIMSEIYKMYRLRIIVTIVLAVVVTVIIVLGAFLFLASTQVDSQIDLKFISINSKSIGAIFMTLGIGLLVYLIKSIPKITIQKKDDTFTLHADE